MQREEIIQICDSQVLEIAAEQFGTRREALEVFPEYEGAANIVYEYEVAGQPLILRISFRPERSIDLIMAELDFVNFLGQNGVKVSRPVPSKNGKLAETIQAEGIPFHVVTFVKGRGMRVPDNGYRYRVDAPIEEYFHNWGRILGQMHALAKNYHPINGVITRPDWFELHRGRLAKVAHLPGRLHRVREKIHSLLDELRTLPRDRDSYGLIHGDFNDGNFTVDYANGEITVFDFDDSCYFWFMYEIASAWEGGVGRVMHGGLNERKSFMEHYMEQLMEGYNRENSLPAHWMERLLLFIRLIQIEELLHYVRYLDETDDEINGLLNYRIRCIEDEIPYMGFFDDIYSPERPFSL